MDRQPATGFAAVIGGKRLLMPGSSRIRVLDQQVIFRVFIDRTTADNRQPTIAATKEPACSSFERPGFRFSG
jgi:hypothetical protein